MENFLRLGIHRGRTFMIGVIASLPLGCGVKVDLLTSNDAGMQDATGGAASTGGAAPAGGADSAGGSVDLGGHAATGGSVNLGGHAAIGGSVELGGHAATGGSVGLGGHAATGGSVELGGHAATGGSVALGGHAATGGSVGLGGQVSSVGGSIVVTSAPVNEDTLITLQRGPCEGTCPMYTVTIDGTGNVNYQGDRFVQVTGSASSQIPLADVQQLVNWMMAMNYLNLSIPDNCPYGTTDMPSAITSLKVTPGYNSVDHYHGNPCAPLQLNLIEDLIDQTANSARWVNGTNLLGTGKPCSVDSECSTGICFGGGGSRVCSAPFGDLCWPDVPCHCGNGFCSTPCTRDADCRSNYICQETETAACVETCTPGFVMDCPLGSACMSIERQGGTANICSVMIN